MKIEVYTKENCPMCVKVKMALKGQGKDFTEIDLTPDNMEDIINKSGARAAPIVFVDNKYMENNDVFAL